MDPTAIAADPKPTEEAKPLTIAESIEAAREALLKPEGQPAAPAGGEGTAAGEGGAKPEGEAAKPGEGEGKPEGQEGEPKPEGGGAAPAAEGAEGAEGEVVEVVVDIPARRPGEKPIQVAFEDKEVAERIQQAVNSGMRREEFRRAMDKVERQREEFDVLEQHLRLDPAGFLVEQIKPEIRVSIVKHLLSLPEVFQAVAAELEEWQADPNVLARRQAELGRDRAEGKRKAEGEFRELEAQRQQARVLSDTIDAITPADMAEAEAEMFRDDCLNDIAAWGRANPSVQRLRPEEVIGILERRLRHYRVDPKSAQAGLSSGQPFRRPSAASPSGAPAPGSPTVEAARTTGAKLKQEGDQRRVAAAVPGAGAGAQPTKLEPPPKQGVLERIKWVKEQFGKR